MRYWAKATNFVIPRHQIPRKPLPVHPCLVMIWPYPCVRALSGDTVCLLSQVSKSTKNDHYIHWAGESRPMIRAVASVWSWLGHCSGTLTNQSLESCQVWFLFVAKALLRFTFHQVESRDQISNRSAVGQLRCA